MQNDIYLIGEVGYEITLQSVKDMVDKANKDEPLNVHIHSIGGSVYDGLAIYNYFKSLSQEINTISSGLVASIASIIFLAGNKNTRKINNTDSFLIHLPSGMVGGNASDFEKHGKELRKIESTLADIYANETSLTKDEAIELMNKDEMIDVNFLKEKGFVNEIVTFKAVAKFNKQEKMTELSNETKGWFEKLFAKHSKPEIVNKIVKTADGKDLDFVNVAEDGTPAIGDEAKIDGSNADGAITMPSGEVWNFAGGKLESKTDAPAQPTPEEMQALQDANAELTNQLAEVNAKLEKVEGIKNELSKDFTDLKAKVKSSFEWEGKQPEDKKESKKEETVSRKLFKN